MSTFISKETTKRLANDIKQIMKNPLVDNGIYYVHDDTDILKGYALIIGSSGTPYFAGNYFFELTFPHNYPYSPPTVKYCTNGNNVRFHPNLYVSGKVCVSLLNTWSGEQWTSCQTISSILLTICSLLTKDPLLNEPGVNKEHCDMNPYTNIIEFSNINVAICDIISKKPTVYNSFFAKFSPHVEDNFKKNYKEIVSFIERKIVTTPPIKLKTQFYSMCVDINYTQLLAKLQDVYTKLINPDLHNVGEQSSNETINLTL
jgi:ubiquitin-protein ligase